MRLEYTDLFRFPFHTCVTAVARKRSRSFCQTLVDVLLHKSQALSLLVFIYLLCLFYKEKLFSSLSELRSCVKVEVAVLGSPSLTVLMVSVDVKRH